MTRFLRDAVVFLVCWLLFAVLGTTALYTTVELPMAHYEREEALQKLALLRQLDQVDTVFVGSSRVYGHIDPIRFDEGRGGVSVNAGSISLLPPRSNDFLDAAVAARPDAQLWVVELLALALVGENWKNDANVRSLTVDRGRDVLDYVRTVPLSVGTRRQYQTGYAKLAGYKLLGFGSARALGLLRAPPPTSDPWRPEVVARRGWISLEHDQAHHIAPAALRAAQQQAAERKATAAGGRGKGGALADPPVGFVDAVVRRGEALRAAGKTVVYFVPPRSHPDSVAILAHQQHVLEEHGFRVLNFDDAARYPSLFDAEAILDTSHFNDEGARRFTDLLRSELGAAGVLP